MAATHPVALFRMFNFTILAMLAKVGVNTNLRKINIDKLNAASTRISIRSFILASFLTSRYFFFGRKILKMKDGNLVWKTKVRSYNHLPPILHGEWRLRKAERLIPSHPAVCRPPTPLSRSIHSAFSRRQATARLWPGFILRTWGGRKETLGHDPVAPASGMPENLRIEFCVGISAQLQ